MNSAVSSAGALSPDLTMRCHIREHHKGTKWYGIERREKEHVHSGWSRNLLGFMSGKSNASSNIIVRSVGDLLVLERSEQEL